MVNNEEDWGLACNRYAQSDEDLDDMNDLDGLEIPDPDIEYQEHDSDDDCEGGACKI